MPSRYSCSIYWHTDHRETDHSSGQWNKLKLSHDASSPYPSPSSSNPCCSHSLFSFLHNTCWSLSLTLLLLKCSTFNLFIVKETKNNAESRKWLFSRRLNRWERRWSRRSMAGCRFIELDTERRLILSCPTRSRERLSTDTKKEKMKMMMTTTTATAATTSLMEVSSNVAQSAIWSFE